MAKRSGKEPVTLPKSKSKLKAAAESKEVSEQEPNEEKPEAKDVEADAWIHVLKAPNEGIRLPLLTSEPIVIGRSSCSKLDCSHDRTISRIHF